MKKLTEVPLRFSAPIKVPFIRPQDHWLEHKDDYLKVIEDVLDSGQYQGDKTTDAFEKRLAEYCGREYAVMVNSGTDALILALKALQLDPGDEVLVPAYSFVATGSAVLNAGLKPVFVDVDPSGFMDRKKLRHMNMDKVKAIIMVSLFGQHPRIPDNLYDGLHFIYDNAQGFDGPMCSYGSMNILSFDPMKTLPAFGSGGAILCDESMLAFLLKGMRKNDSHSPVPSQNSQMSAMTAALLNYKLDFHEVSLIEQNRIATFYEERLPLNVRSIHSRSCHKFPIFTKDQDERDNLKKFLDSKGIETKIHYPYILPELEMFGDQDDWSWSVAKIMSETELSLPIYPSLTIEKAEYVISAIKEFYTSHA